MKKEKITTLINESLKIAPSFRRNVIHGGNFCGNLKLSPHQHICLHLIYQFETISMSELAKKLGVSNQQITRIMNSLVENKWVLRYTSKENRRIVLTQITDEGVKVINYLKDKIHEHLSLSFNILTEAELDECIKHFKAINKILAKLNN